MYTVIPYEPKIKLISNGSPQEVHEFSNYTAFLDWCSIGFIQGRIVDKHSKGTAWDLATIRDRQNHYYWDVFKPICYIVRDEFGSMFSINEIEHDYYARRQELKRLGIIRRPRWFMRYEHPYEFRKDPVPTTGKRGGYRVYRHPKTTQELRRNGYEPEYSRGRRRKGYLRNSWDDILRSSYRERKNWKRNRKTQWKNK